MTPDNFTLAAVCGVITFLLMLAVKIPIKLITRKIAASSNNPEYEKRVLNKRLNLSVIAATFLLGIAVFLVAVKFFNIEHLSISHGIETGAFAIAYYALAERFFRVSPDCPEKFS